ncbi:MAG: 2TM domain-containing protein [Chloroflexi bacterium]|nr:2TM domain-containing protein [Chloroflexota bacterium]
MDAEEREKELRRRAEKRVEDKLAFFKHLVVYLLVNAFLFGVNMLTAPHFLWFFFPLGGWGIALAAHFVTVFMLGGTMVEAWREREIVRETEKLRKRE